MIPANSQLCSSSRNIKKFQRDLRFSQIMTNHQTQLLSINHKSPQCSEKVLFPKPIYQRQILIGGPPPPLLSMPFAITWLQLADHQSEHAQHEFWGILPVTMLPPLLLLALLLLVAVTCRRRRKSPLDGARDLLSQIGQHITTVLCKFSFLFVPGSPKTALDMSKWDLKIILFVSNMSGGFF